MKKNILVITLAVIVSFSGITHAKNTSVTTEYQNLLLEDDNSVKQALLSEKMKPYSWTPHFKENSTFEEVMNYEGIKDFAKLIFPIKNKGDEKTQLRDLFKLMPLHHNVNPNETLESVEYLANTTDWGLQAFYRIYPTDKSVDINGKVIDHKNVGVFYFRGKADAPYAVIVSGGYSYQSILHEGFPLALELIKKGYNVFVLSNSTLNITQSTRDLTQAINFIHKNAAILHVDPNSYSLWGYSQGAQAIVNLMHKVGRNSFIDKLEAKPNMNAFIYPLRYYVKANDVPSAFVIGEEDQIVNLTILKSAEADFKKLNLRSLFITIPGYAHGFGLGASINVDDSPEWVNKITDFWKNNTANPILKSFAGK